MPTTQYAAEMREAREKSGIIQTELAKAAGFHRALLNSVETGKRHAFHVSRTQRLVELMGEKEKGVRLMALAAAERGIDAKMLQDLTQDAIEALIELALLLPSLPDSKVTALRKVLDSLKE